MKASTILTFTLIPQSLAATDQQNSLTCGSRFPKINGAIEKFCYQQNNGILSNSIVIPSTYAKTGIKFYGLKGEQLQIRITGNCNPPQWLPANWCLSQFHDLCASTKDPRGYNVKTCGNSHCQSFQIGGWVN